jgi:hypothetical protein
MACCTYGVLHAPTVLALASLGASGLRGALIDAAKNASGFVPARMAADITGCRYIKNARSPFVKWTSRAFTPAFQLGTFQNTGTFTIAHNPDLLLRWPCSHSGRTWPATPGTSPAIIGTRTPEDQCQLEGRLGRIRQMPVGGAWSLEWPRVAHGALEI